MLKITIDRLDDIISHIARKVNPKTRSEVKRFVHVHDESLNTSEMVEIEDGGWVSYEDYDWMADYADRLVEHGNLPCLPKDLENLREANTQLANENLILKATLSSLQEDLTRMTL